MRADGNAGFDLKLDAVLGHGGDELLAAGGIRAINNLGIHRSHYGFENALTGLMRGEINGGGLIETEVERGFLRSDQGTDDLVHVAAGKVVSFELVSG